MILDRLRLKNFRCFGPEWTEVAFEPGVTAFVGSNGSGKTAVFRALARLFGISRAQRTVVRRDFHVPVSASEPAKSLELEAQLAFPELDQDNADPDGVPEFFRHFIVQAEDGRPFCRVRLRASWTDDGTTEGAIEEDIRWVTVPEEFSHQDWQQFPRVSPAERAGIQLVYVPASRDVAREVSAVLGRRLWRAAIWSNEFADTVKEVSERLQKQFGQEGPVRIISKALVRRWQELHRGDTDRIPVFRLVESELDRLVRRAEVVFQPDEAGGERPLEELSDGQRALFHIALTAATLAIERTAHAPDTEHFHTDRLARPHLTLLVIEEPENHLAPFFLARIIDQARAIACNDAQVLISSHSASILGRIEPPEARYFRLDEDRRTSSVRKLTLPEEQNDAWSYIRLAVRAYPELYFARFVILAEGDSERIVIPRVAQAMGIPLDPSFVPVVPLGGRHVEHFWRLLEDLGIPYATLIDLDCGRPHGGPKTIRTILRHLKSFKSVAPNETIASLKNSEKQTGCDKRSIVRVLTALESFDVFFTRTLDLDMAMLSKFPEAYKGSVPEGHGPPTNASAEKARRAVLGSEGGPKLYHEKFDDLFLWYRYLFLYRSKPGTHLAALSRLSDEDLAKRSPAVLRRLVRYVAIRIGVEPSFSHGTDRTCNGTD